MRNRSREGHRSASGDGADADMESTEKIEHKGLMSPSRETLVGRFDLRNAAKLLLCALGILICYFYFGLIQEKITKSKYGDENELFTYTQALVLFLCVGNTLFAFTVLRITKSQEDDTPSHMYAMCAFSYLAAMMASNHALQFIPYPTQVVGKSCKPIPIMIFGVLFARKRYNLLKYLFVLMIVVGVALFLYKEKKGSAAMTSSWSFGWGEVLLLISLSMDGTTGAIQDRIRALRTINGHSMMYNMNVWSTVYLVCGLVLTGELISFVAFVQRHPTVLVSLSTLAVASALGQFFIFKTVSDFGPLTCSIITTTRKFFTVLGSVFLFGNTLSSRQWIGTVLVFVGLFLDGALGKTKKNLTPEAK